VRGYLESSAAGDAAMRGTIELRSGNLRPDAARVNHFEGRLFVDAAYLSLRAPLPGTASRFKLASYGAGLTLRAQPGLQVRADLAWPVFATTFQKAHEPRLQASAGYEF
jgi:hemolysin activation/secretion protein